MSYLMRHDAFVNRDCLHGYFLPGIIGYALGLISTMIALSIMKTGQPALLYLVPCTLGPTLLLGWCRGEFSILWNGVPDMGNDSCGEKASSTVATAVVLGQPHASYRPRTG